VNKRSAAIFAVSGFALAAVVSVAPARASTVTDLISFSATGTYATDGDPTHGYQGTATANGSFKITFDPTQLYLTQSITGIITNLTYSITDPFFGGLLPLNTITQFAFDGSGTLKLCGEYRDCRNPGYHYWYQWLGVRHCIQRLVLAGSIRAHPDDQRYCNHNRVGPRAAC